MKDVFFIKTSPNDTQAEIPWNWQGRFRRCLNAFKESFYKNQNSIVFWHWFVLLQYVSCFINDNGTDHTDSLWNFFRLRPARYQESCFSRISVQDFFSCPRSFRKQINFHLVILFCSELVLMRVEKTMTKLCLNKKVLLYECNSVAYRQLHSKDLLCCSVSVLSWPGGTPVLS